MLLHMNTQTVLEQLSRLDYHQAEKHENQRQKNEHDVSLVHLSDAIIFPTPRKFSMILVMAADKRFNSSLFFPSLHAQSL